MAQLQIPSIPQFNPKGDPNNTGQKWEKWKRSFEYFILASGIENDDRKRALLLHLLGTATQEIFETLPDKGTSFKEAIDTLDKHFIVKKNVPYERSIFHSAKQKPNESIEQFVTTLRKLSLYCEYGAMTEEHIRDQVIDGCHSSKFRKKLLIETGLTLAKVIQLGKITEAANHQSEQMESSKSDSATGGETINKIGQQPSYHQRHQYGSHNQNRHNFQRQNRNNFNRNTFNQNNKHQQQRNFPPRSKTMCGRCGAMGHSSTECQRSKDKTCNTCGKLGHFQKMCKSMKRTDRQPQRRHRVHNINTEEPESEEPSVQNNQEEYEDIYVFKIGENQETHTISIHNTDINVLIDSGSVINIMDEPAFNQLEPKPSLTVSKTNIFPYKATQPIPVKGKFTTNIYANKLEHYIPLYSEYCLQTPVKRQVVGVECFCARFLQRAIYHSYAAALLPCNNEDFPDCKRRLKSIF